MKDFLIGALCTLIAILFLAALGYVLGAYVFGADIARRMAVVTVGIWAFSSIVVIGVAVLRQRRIGRQT